MRVEQTQDEMRVQLESLGKALATRSFATFTLTPGTLDPVAIPVEPAGTTELIARLATLSERVEQLTRVMSAGDAQLADAAHDGRAAPVEAVDDVAIEPLREALLVLERQRALHIENLANVQSQGYKLRTMSVTTALHEASGLQLPKAGPVCSLMTTGTLEITERCLDVAIDGAGFFVARGPDGVDGYTRCGSLHLSGKGQLVTGSGAVLQPPVTVPSDTLEISIDPEGRVTGRTASQPDTSSSFGQVQLARFVDAGQLLPDRDGMLQAGPGGGAAIVGLPGERGLGILKQGFIERSNVQMLNELVALQLVERQMIAVRRVLAGYGIYTR